MAVYIALAVSAISFVGIILFAVLKIKKPVKIVGALICAVILVISAVVVFSHKKDSGSKISSAVSSQSVSSEEAEPLFTEINHYAIRRDERYFITDEDYKYVKKLIDAIFERKEIVELSSDYDSNLRVLSAAMESPYYFVVKDDKFSSDHKSVKLTYEYSEKEHNEMLRFIDDEYLKILNSCIKADMNDVDKVLAIHHYFAKRIDYNYDWLDALNMSDEKYLFPDIAVYEALKTNRGVCHTYTYLCEFALRQLGIECIRFTGDLDGDEDKGHMWYIAKLNGKFYHFDTTWDANNENDKVTLIHFAMTDEDRRRDGFDLHLYEFDDSYSGIACNDDRFAVLRNVADYKYLGNHKWEMYTDLDKTEIYDSVANEVKEN